MRETTTHICRQRRRLQERILSVRIRSQRRHWGDGIGNSKVDYTQGGPKIQKHLTLQEMQEGSPLGVYNPLKVWLNNDA